MRKLFLFASLCITISGFAQKKITCKKGSVKADGTLIAEYDGVGGMFKAVRLGVFAQGSKDTLISLKEESYNAQNPLFPDGHVAYKLEFKNSNLPSFYIHDPKSPSTRLFERDVMGLLFNDTVPVLVSQNKLDEAAVESFRSKYAFNLDTVKKFIAHVEDSLAIINKIEIVRDHSKPVTLRVVNDNSNQYEVSQVLEMYQDGILLGRIIKKVSPGSFSKADYTFWKAVTPVTIGGIDMKYSPVATCSTGETTFEIPVISVIGKKEFKVKGNYNALELRIANLLVQQKLL